MRFTIDFEFLEDGRFLEHVSVGIVSESGDEYYAVSGDMPVASVLAHPFLREQVWPKLPRITLPSDARGLWEQLDRSHADVKPKTQIATEVRDFLLAPGTPVELFAWYAAFDHVALAWLWGPMVDLPKGIPMYTRDIKDLAVRLGDPRLPEQDPATKHHALHDARHDWVYLRELEHLEHIWQAAP